MSINLRPFTGARAGRGEAVGGAGKSIARISAGRDEVQLCFSGTKRFGPSEALVRRGFRAHQVVIPSPRRRRGTSRRDLRPPQRRMCPS